MSVFTISVKAAIETLMPIAGFAASERSQNEVYKHVLITNNGSQCFAIGCNGAQSVIRSVPIPLMSEPFKVCIDGVKLRAILSSLKDAAEQELSFSWTESVATIKVGRSKLTAAVVNPDSFPHPDRLGDEHFEIVINGSVLLQSLRSVAHSCAARDVRHYLNGCHLKISDSSFSVTGSDGHRISRVIKPLAGQSGNAEGIVPLKLLDLLQANVDKNVGDIRVRISANMAEFTWTGGQIRSTLIDGKYPDTSGFFNCEPKRLFSCSKHALLQSISRLKSTAFEKLPSLAIDAENGELRLATLDERKEESGTDFIAATLTNAELTQLSVNIIYLSDSLNQIEDDEVLFELVSGNSLKIQSVNNPDFNAIIAQLRR